MERATRRVSTRASAAAAAAIVASGVLLVPVPAGAAPARTCGPVTVWPAPNPLPSPTEPISSAPSPAPANGTAALDMDGDDIVDQVAVDEQPTGSTITVTRTDGVLTLTDVLPDPPYAGYPAEHGSSTIGDDLDGDGHDELVRTRWAIPGFRQPLRYETTIVRGTTAPGTASVDDIALQFTGTVVGDIDGDGLDDLEFSDSAPGWTPASRWMPADQAIGGTIPNEISPSATVVGARVDLDLDGLPDQIVAGSADRSVPSSLELTMGGSRSEDLDPGPTSVWVGRHDIRTFVAFVGTPSVIEVKATCAPPWLADASALLLGRGPTAAEQVGFGTEHTPDRHQRVQRAHTFIRSQTGRGHLVDESFAWFLGRSADPVGRAWWVRQLRAGARTPERMMNELLGSAERWRTAGSTSAGWVDATYASIMGRVPDPSGRAYWIRQVEELGPRRTAVRLFDSAEAKRFLVRRYASKPMAMGSTIPPDLQAELDDALRFDRIDGMLLALASSPEHYLAANARHVIP
ncbi:DUF4214 domain-containing protein [Aquihabitans daechungensis]|uniref:DUF4214 domain-containing protein n=1 Tax=Aquihabitans daechungensis TaxID=1052257 RepID=UPI003BA35261